MPSIIYAATAPEELVGQAVSKSDWYNLLDQIGVESAPMFDGEDSFPAWQYALEKNAPDEAVGKLFQGDKKSVEDDTGDPHVAYLGNASVSLVANELSRLGRVHFENILKEAGSENDIWLFEGLLAFLTDSAKKGTSVFVLWGN